MPIYEYHCDPCDLDFEALIRSPEDRPACPRCNESQDLEKRPSVPASAQSSSSLASASAALRMGGCGAPACCGGGGCAIN